MGFATGDHGMKFALVEYEVCFVFWRERD